MSGFTDTARRLYQALYGEAATPASVVLSDELLVVWFFVELDEVRAALRRYRMDRGLLVRG